MNRKNKQIIREKRERLRQELLRCVSIDRYIKIIGYLKATELIKPRDKIETNQLKL